MSAHPLSRPDPIVGAELAWLAVGAVARWARGCVRRWWLSAVAPIDRQGAALLSFGAGFVLNGLSLLRPQTPDNLAAFGPAPWIMPVGAWGAVFMLAGFTTLATVHSTGTPRRVALAALVGLAAFWGVAGLVAPLMAPASMWGWIAGLVWLLVVVPLLLIVAGVGDRVVPP